MLEPLIWENQARSRYSYICKLVRGLIGKHSGSSNVWCRRQSQIQKGVDFESNHCRRGSCEGWQDYVNGAISKRFSYVAGYQ